MGRRRSAGDHGLVGNSDTQILSGLKAGEVVVEPTVTVAVGSTSAAGPRPAVAAASVRRGFAGGGLGGAGLGGASRLGG